MEIVFRFNKQINRGLMEKKNLFKDTNAETLWDNYFSRVSKQLIPLGRAEAEEITAEIKSHLWQGFEEMYNGDEVNALLSAIEKLGEPEDFLRRSVAEILIESGTRRFSVISIMKGLIINIGTGLKNLILSFMFFIGYLFVFAFGLLSFVKIIYPENVGFYIWDNGRVVAGFISDADFADELLGYWIIPLMLILSVLLYVLLTRLLRLVLSGRKNKTTLY